MTLLALAQDGMGTDEDKDVDASANGRGTDAGAEVKAVGSDESYVAVVTGTEEESETEVRMEKGRRARQMHTSARAAHTVCDEMASTQCKADKQCMIESNLFKY